MALAPKKLPGPLVRVPLPHLSHSWCNIPFEVYCILCIEVYRMVDCLFEHDW